MKFKFSNASNIKRLTIVSLFILMAFVSCTPKISFVTSNTAPAAEGSVKVKKDKNNNYNIDLNVSHLADPEKLNPAKSMYVVWMESERNGTKNLGRLNTSNKLTGSLQTVTAFKPVKIFITAETDATIQQPSWQVVLNTNNF